MRRRTAIATLELVMALPVVLALFVAMVWLGFAVIEQAKVTTEARHEAWKQRFQPWTQTPFAFTETQEVTETADADVNVTQLLSGVEGAKSQHTVRQSSWDHRTTEFKSLPNWKLYADTAIAAKREGLMSAYQDAKSQFDQLRSLGSQALADALAEAVSDLLGPGQTFESSGSSQESRLELDQQLEKQRIEGEIRDLEQSIDDQKRIIDELKDSEEEDDQDRLWLEEKKLERLKTELKDRKETRDA
ncbi:MAG: hypothetical protein AAGA03_03060 [Planctomycetota bacterium]